MYYKANRYNAFNSALNSEDINAVIFIQYNIAQIMDSLHTRRVQTDSSGNKKGNRSEEG
jgi:hypothetical protein